MVTEFFDDRPVSQGGRFFTAEQCNVTPTSRQHCSPLQQWRCDAVIDFFAAYNATVAYNALQTNRISHFALAALAAKKHAANNEMAYDSLQESFHGCSLDFVRRS